MIEKKDWKTRIHVQDIGGLRPIRVYSNGTSTHFDKQEFYEQQKTILIKAPRVQAQCDEEKDISLHHQMGRSLNDECLPFLIIYLRLWNFLTKSIIGCCVHRFV